MNSASTIWAMCRCPRPWSTISPSTISRSSIPASMRQGRGRYRSAAIIPSPVRSCALSAGQNPSSRRGAKLALVHFDAHRDDYEYLPHWLGSKRSAAHWAAYTIREGIVDPDHSIQLGMRGNPMRAAPIPPRVTRAIASCRPRRSLTSGPRRSCASSASGSAICRSISPSTWTPSTPAMRRRWPIRARLSGAADL